ncbi:RagB/SusD family nutrient uptake outer membrane protein [Dysgonomonas reticulitermitis]
MNIQIKSKLYIVLAGLLLTLWSCQDYEDVPVEKITIEYVFSPTDSLGVNAKKYLNNVYSVLRYGHNYIDGDYLDAASDDAITSSLSENQIYQLQIGRYSPFVRLGDMGWAAYYRGIRRANTFINNIDVVPFMQTYNNHVGTNIPLNRALKAEARFLKAFYYFELIKRYGGVPLVGDVPYELGEPMELPRNTFDECVEYIVSELDNIKDSLRSVPIANVGSEGHVVTAGAAMALKTRVLLYAASPLFNESPIENGNAYVGYEKYDAARWSRAAQAAEDFINDWGPEGRYGGYGLMDNFKEVFLNYYGSNSNEVIFHTQGALDRKDVETNNGPVGFSSNAKGNGETSPTQNLVDAFPMKDGKPIGQSAKYTYSEQSMYDNRDPRLDYTILHNGSQWLSTTVYTYIGGRNNPTGSTDATTKTSYYMRKFMGNYEDKTEYTSILRNWVLFRYAEILLNYAEAKNEYDLASSKATADAKVISYIREIRKRGGIEGDDGTYGIADNTTCLEMRTLIRNERRIEMAFEEQRFYDIRRWKIAEEIFSQPLKGLALVMKTGNIQIEHIDVLDAKFDPKRYLYPISYDEVNKNNNMVQNPGW